MKTSVFIRACLGGVVLCFGGCSYVYTRPGRVALTDEERLAACSRAAPHADTVLSASGLALATGVALYDKEQFAAFGLPVFVLAFVAAGSAIYGYENVSPCPVRDDCSDLGCEEDCSGDID